MPKENIPLTPCKHMFLRQLKKKKRHGGKSRDFSQSIITVLPEPPPPPENTPLCIIEYSHFFSFFSFLFLPQFSPRGGAGVEAGE